jgi:hypothetical protein
MRMSERCGDDLRDDLTYARKKAQAVARNARNRLKYNLSRDSPMNLIYPN